MISVKLYVYDLSKGLAANMSAGLLGFHLPGIWHTAVVLDNKDEIYFGAGIQRSQAGQTHHGAPVRIIDMGETEVPRDVIEEYLAELQETYTKESYDLFDHNCNNMSQDLCEFLVGKGIPQYILDMPKQVLSTPFGQMLRPMLTQAMSPIVQREDVETTEARA